MKKKMWDELTKKLKFRNNEESASLRKSIEGKWQIRKNIWWKENNGIEVKGGEEDFVRWYIKNIGVKMPGRCHYCGLEGDIKKNYGKYYEKGNRKNCGERLEIDKKDPSPNSKYSESNCVLACYPCNNAKSDVFTDKEFEIIGAVIGALKTNRKNLESNNFIKGLIKNVKKTANRKI